MNLLSGSCSSGLQCNLYPLKSPTLSAKKDKLHFFFFPPLVDILQRQGYPLSHTEFFYSRLTDLMMPALLSFMQESLRTLRLILQAMKLSPARGHDRNAHDPALKQKTQDEIGSGFSGNIRPSPDHGINDQISPIVLRRGKT
jgi:hypothetical protein